VLTDNRYFLLIRRYVFFLDRTRKQLKEGVLPSKNLPFQKTESDEQHLAEQSTEMRKLYHETQLLKQQLAEQASKKKKLSQKGQLVEQYVAEKLPEKRKLCQEFQLVKQHLAEQTIEKKEKISIEQHAISTCYKDYNDFLENIQKLKLEPLWKIMPIDEQTIEIIRTADDTRSLLPFLQIFVNENLTYRLRCFGWLLPVENSIHSCYESFKCVTLSDFIANLQNYHICSGLDLNEFKESIYLQHHIIPLRFDFPSSVTDLPVSQQEYIRSVRCSLLIEKHISKCNSCKELEVKTRSELNWKNLTMMADTCFELSRGAKVGRYTNNQK